MKVLWIANVIFPPACDLLGISHPVSGGWMYSIAKSLVETNEVELTVASLYEGDLIRYYSKDSINYCLLPYPTANFTYNYKLEKEWFDIVNKIKPDLVHIHGTEFLHGLTLVNALPNLKYVISIQGLVSVIARYYNAGIGILDRWKSITLKNILKFERLNSGQIEFEMRGDYEKQYFAKVRHVIGRTEWDKCHSKNISREIVYHHCNECLRKAFYTGNWQSEFAEKHTIFLSQASYPIKGLHKVLEAIELIKTRYPKIKIKVAGDNILKPGSFKNQIKRNWYGNYIRKYINKNNLITHVEFTGPLNEREMASMLETSRIFICPSSIENSSNSIGEAQLVGTPVIASLVGGVLDMVEHRKTGLLYRFEEVEVLAEYISELFENDLLAQELSQAGRIAAGIRHDWKKNTSKMIEIYSKVQNYV